MEVRICARCISTETIQNFNIKLSDVKCIWDLKKILEQKLSVAACDQTIYYEKRLLEDGKSLSSLYVKKGDSFNVEFLACCDVEKLRSVLREMKKFLETVCESYSGLETLSSVADNRDQYVDCSQDIYGVLEISSMELFIPWKSQTSVANRHYFTQEGGLDILSSIYKFAQKTFRLTETHTGVEETEMFETVTDNQKLLEYCCLSALWNYSELEEDRRIVLKKIGLDMFIKSLIKSPWQAQEVDPEVVNINDSAVGCLAQYLEMPDIQQFVAEHYFEAVTKLVWLSSNSTALFGKEVAANTLFCCSIHPKAALKMLENKVHQSVITMMMPLLSISGNNEMPVEFDNTLSTAMQYFFCLFLANIVSLPNEKILTDQEKINEVIEKFLSLHAPLEVGDFEMAHQYVWVSLVSFVQLALSSSNVKTLQSGQAMRQFSSAGKVGLFSLCHLTKSRINRELFKKEKLLDYLVCICWFAKKCERNRLVPELTQFEKIEPPRLQSIAKAYLVKCYGHRITRYGNS